MGTLSILPIATFNDKGMVKDADSNLLHFKEWFYEEVKKLCPWTFNFYVQSLIEMKDSKVDQSFSGI